MIHRVLRNLIPLVTLGLTTVVCHTAHADGDDDADEVATYAIQRRLFRIGLELNGGAGMLPINAFDKGFIVNCSVTWHFNSFVGWEIAQASYVFAQLDTGLKQQLMENFQVQPTELATPLFLGSTNVVFTPFYGKLAGMNQSVSHVELFFPVGLALGRYENPATFQEGIDLGLGLRWFLGPRLSARLDARDFMLTPGLKNFSLTNELLFALGLSVAFGGAER
ncbi:MAG: outer membrane beta-barrel domain-containing protein [Polyangiaceae bacterium]|jgi:outer membrane beta-barrel protein